MADQPELVTIATWMLMRVAEISSANLEVVVIIVGKGGLRFPTREADQERDFEATGTAYVQTPSKREAGGVPRVRWQGR